MVFSLIAIVLLIMIGYGIRLYRFYFPPIPKRKDHYEYALLLGCPNHDDGTYSTSQIKRCDLAVKAYREHLFDTLVISGGAVHNEYVESLEMKKRIVSEIDMPVLCETKARNTWENFQNTRDIIGDVPILILSSGTHIRRGCAIAASFFSEYSGYAYTDHKPRHIVREIVSRFVYISIEMKKKRK